MYQIQNVQIIFQYEALHGPLEICEYPQRLRRGEGGGKGGSTQLSWTVPLVWERRRRNAVVTDTGNVVLETYNG